MPLRRTKVRSSDHALIVSVGVASGFALLLLGVRPTGTLAIDLIALPLVSVIVVGCSASAPWWALAVAATMASCWSAHPVGTVAGALAMVASLWLGWRRRGSPVGAAVIAATTLVVLGTLRDLRWFGASTYIGVAIAVLVSAFGLARLQRTERRRVAVTLGVGIAIMTVGITSLLLTAARARADLVEGERAARMGITSLRQGDLVAARAHFGRSSVALERARSVLDGAWAFPSRFVPVAGQHRLAAADLAAGAGRASEAIGKQLAGVDLNRLRISDGQIDIAALGDLQTSLDHVGGALRRLEDDLGQIDRSWLVPSLSSRMNSLGAEVSEQRLLASKLDAALEIAPELLGAGQQRVYLIMFTTQGEARGSGGFMGNWAELTVTDGKIEMTAFGNDEILNRGGEGPRRILDAPDDWLANWSEYGFRTGFDGGVGQVPWKNITMSPNFPSVAMVASELYPQSGGRPVDGVLNLDITALAGLIGMAGPFRIDGSPVPLTGRNAAEFLLRGQYEQTDNLARGDLLESVALTTLTTLLERTPPDLIEVGQVLGPLAQRGHVMAWSSHAAEQRVIETAGLTGGLPENRVDRTEIVVVANNAAANKLDSLIEHHYEFRAGTDGTAELTLRIDNFTDTARYPDYIASNRVGLPRGDTRLLVSVYSDATVDAVRVDGAPIEHVSSTEGGLNVATVFVDVPQQVGAVVVVELSGVCSACDVYTEQRPAGGSVEWDLS